MRGRIRLATPAMATALGVLLVALMLLAIPLSRAAAAAHVSSGGSWSTVVIIVPFALVGVVVARRQPRNAVGWILLATALLFVVQADGSMYTVLD